MRSGDLNKPIVIQAKTVGTDEWGGDIDVWTTFATTRAGVYPLKGRELISAKAAQSEVTTRFRIRFIDGITSAMRIVYNGKNYDIDAVTDPKEKHRELWIMATTGTNEG